MTRTKPITITVRRASETAAAVYVHQGNPARAVWLPLSQINIEETGERVNGQPVCTVTLPKWLADQSKLAGDVPRGPGLFDGGER